jgi:hypothetical protein
MMTNSLSNALNLSCLSDIQGDMWNGKLGICLWNSAKISYLEMYICKPFMNIISPYQSYKDITLEEWMNSEQRWKDIT